MPLTLLFGVTAFIDALTGTVLVLLVSTVAALLLGEPLSGSGLALAPHPALTAMVTYNVLAQLSGDPLRQRRPGRRTAAARGRITRGVGTVARPDVVVFERSSSVMVATTLISDTPADCRAYGWQTSRMQRVEVISTPKPVLEIFVGTLFLIVVIFVHGAGIRSISRQFNESWVHVTSATPHWRLNIMLAATIAALALLHFAETLIWAVPLYVKEIIPSMRDSYYYVLESYTTLGEGSVTLPDRWRLLGPTIAMSGLFTFGWTGSVLVSIMTDFGRFDRLQARQERTDEDKAES